MIPPCTDGSRSGNLSSIEFFLKGKKMDLFSVVFSFLTEDKKGQQTKGLMSMDFPASQKGSWREDPEIKSFLMKHFVYIKHEGQPDERAVKCFLHEKSGLSSNGMPGRWTNHSAEAEPVWFKDLVQVPLKDRNAPLEALRWENQQLRAENLKLKAELDQLKKV